MLEQITEFLDTKTVEGKSWRTIYDYRMYLGAFAEHCNYKPLAEVNNADAVRWIAAEKTRGLSDVSILSRVRALKTFFTWCVYYDLLPKTPIKMPRPKVRQKQARVADLGDIETLLQHPCNSWLDYRNRALIHLLYDTGMRIGEAGILLVAHLDFDNRIVHIPAGKDNEPRPAPFTRSCAAAIKEYLSVRPPGKHDRWLFVGGKGHGIVAPLTTNGARMIMRRCCQAAGVPYINPHSIRHCFATRALNSGMRVEIVSKILGHSSVDLTLSIYAKLFTETIQREYAQYLGD